MSLILNSWLKQTDGDFLSLGLQHTSRFSAATLSSQLLSFGLEIMPGLVSLWHEIQFRFSMTVHFLWFSWESVFRVPMSESSSNSSLLRNVSFYISANIHWETHFAVTELKFLLKIGRLRFKRHEELFCIGSFKILFLIKGCSLRVYISFSSATCGVLEFAENKEIREF